MSEYEQLKERIKELESTQKTLIKLIRHLMGEVETKNMGPIGYSYHIDMVKLVDELKH